MKKNFKNEDIDDKYKKKVKQEETYEVLKYCLVKIRNRVIKKYDTRKQRAYIRACLLKPKSLSVDAMSSRIKILNNYLTSFSLLENKSFS